ncbi:CidA/LrgA family protein [Peribacillus deserti]|uniref:CidA/LrgA family protein n=1 Tax=Peribacillus deserti TaxID=673318 RepID=A0A2N5M6G0_9BACI|nr:CidA/LrgA family protein [Peribacillus deserti]PLT29937.1 CidA/LrgA family protein [Peribacillus deserti]
MKIFFIICQTAILYGFFLLGEFIQGLLHISIPGSIIGMLILFSLLHVKWFRPRWIETGSHFLIKIMPLLFIPATVGAMDYLSLFRKYPSSLGIVFISTMIVIILSSAMSQRLNRNKLKKVVSEAEKEMSI